MPDETDIDSLNDIILQVYNDRIGRGYSHDEAVAGAMAYDRILRGEEPERDC